MDEIIAILWRASIINYVISLIAFILAIVLMILEWGDVNYEKRRNKRKNRECFGTNRKAL